MHGIGLFNIYWITATNLHYSNWKNNAIILQLYEIVQQKLQNIISFSNYI